MSHQTNHLLAALLAAGILTASTAGIARGAQRATISGDLAVWHRVVLTVDGPSSGESASSNPFLDVRLDVVFTNGKRSLKVPGFYAADGRAAETSATSGSKWRAYFLPPAEGGWRYTATLRTARGVALQDDPAGGDPRTFTGEFTVGPTDKTGCDHRARGLLRYTQERYLRFAGTGEYFIKGGADSPENFLAYADFDGTYDVAPLRRKGEAAGGKFLHHYEPHVADWRKGDPAWKGGKGKGIIGALNYLASKGMNSVYFLTMNVQGDGKDVWPWTSDKERLRFDVSKLAQWEIVFSHMDRLGILLHVVTQETENDQLLDGGELGPERKLYYRELVARFAHHPALVWNLGEENTNTDAQRKAFARYLHALDAYDHPVVIHTFPGKYEKVYGPLLGYPYLEGTSLQTNDTHAQTVQWVRRSSAAGRPWIVCLDEIGPAHTGVKPDSADPAHDEVRVRHLWGNLLGGGAGVEWYFGYKFPHNDLNCEDWRSRERMWDLTRHALEFFHQHLPFETMAPRDDLLAGAPGYCLADPPRIHAAMFFSGKEGKLDLGKTAGAFTVKWYDTRRGGALQPGSVPEVAGPGVVSLGAPPEAPLKSWVVLAARKKNP